MQLQPGHSCNVKRLFCCRQEARVSHSAVVADQSPSSTLRVSGGPEPGHKGNAIAYQQLVEPDMQWLVCQTHANIIADSEHECIKLLC
jgi:hypothetical protein